MSVQLISKMLFTSSLQDNDGYCDKSGVHDDAKQMHIFAAIIGAGIPGIN